jgi:hypothetical protein
LGDLEGEFVLVEDEVAINSSRGEPKAEAGLAGMPRCNGENARGPASAGNRSVDLEGEERSPPANRFARRMLHDGEEQLAA